MKTMGKSLWIAFFGLALAVPVLVAIATPVLAAPPAGETLPEGKTADTPVERVYEIQTYFYQGENKVHIQIPGPETLYMWQNMSRFFNTAQVLRDGPISTLDEEIDPAIGEVTFERIDGSVETVNEHFEQYPMDALLVVHDGKIVFERYKTMRPYDKHNWFSASKVIGSTMLALLETEGKVDVKLPVSHYIKELEGSEWDTVTLEETLDMATGLDTTEHDEPGRDSRTNPEQLWFRWAASLGLATLPSGLEEEPLELMRKMERRRPGYEAFEYNSINTFAVDVVVERVTGKPLNEVFGERVWRKAGMQADAFWLVNKQGLPMSWGWMNSNLRDLARFGMLFTPSWDKVASEQIIPDSVVKKIQTEGRPEIYNRAYLGQTFQKYFPDDEVITNRYQWDAVFSDGDIFKKGFAGQGLYISPSRDAVVVYFSTGTGQTQEETMARAIVKSFDK